MRRGCRRKPHESSSLFSWRYDKFPESGNITSTLNTTIVEWRSIASSYHAIMSNNFRIDSIEKCLWILRKKFNFATTSKLRISEFQSLKLSLKALVEIKFPMLISVQSSQAIYKHVVVVWRNKSLILNVSTRIHWLKNHWDKCVVFILHFNALFVGTAYFHPK